MIRLIVLDIDGTLTDGSIYYGSEGVEIKKFNVKDGVGILSAEAAGIDVMFLTGRESEAVERRARDLKVKYCIQGMRDKKAYLTSFALEKGYALEEILYIGDDLNDISCMRLVGNNACPADAANEVKEISQYVSKYEGGHGAVRDCIFHYLKEMDLYENAIAKAYGGI